MTDSYPKVKLTRWTTNNAKLPLKSPVRVIKCLSPHIILQTGRTLLLGIWNLFMIKLYPTCPLRVLFFRLLNLNILLDRLPHFSYKALTMI